MKSLKEQVEEIALCGSYQQTKEKIMGLIRADRKAHGEALKVIEQKKKDHTCEFDCVGCLANGFNAARLTFLVASEKYQREI